MLLSLLFSHNWFYATPFLVSLDMKIFPPEKEKKTGKKIVDKRRAWAIARGDRDRATLGPFKPNYTEDSDLYENLLIQVDRVALEIVDSFKRRG